MKHPKNEQLFSLLANHLPAAIILTHTNRIEVIYQNQTVENLCTAKLQGILNKINYNIENEQQLANALLNGKIRNDECLKAELQNGTNKWVSVHISPLIKIQKEIGVIVFFTDITDIMQQLERLRERLCSLDSG